MSSQFKSAGHLDRDLFEEVKHKLKKKNAREKAREMILCFNDFQMHEPAPTP